MKLFITQRTRFIIRLLLVICATFMGALMLDDGNFLLVGVDAALVVTSSIGLMEFAPPKQNI